MPWCTAHYGFHMPLWHIPFALSGQTYSAVEKTLSFDVKIECPFTVPVLVTGGVGTLTCKQATWTLAVTLGELDLNLVSIAHAPRPVTKTAVHLLAGQSTTIV